MSARVRRMLVAAALSVAALVLGGCAEEYTPGAVHVLEATGTVDHVFERYVDRGIAQAEDDRAGAVVLRVDTPGGSVDAMRQVVSRIEESRVPVITYVSPAGGQAASAGTFIVMAGHLAGMAPSTTIGAATPIDATGEDIEGALGRKVTNDIAAFARGVAESRGRNAAWAEQAVREAVSASSSEAVDLDVVDLVAADVPALLREVDGRTVRVGGSDVQLRLQGVPVVENGQNAYERVLRILSDPLVVSLLLLIGIAGIVFEFHAPGLFAPAAIGVVSLMLALVGVGTLLPEEATMALIAAGIVLLLLELVLPGGIAGMLGAVSLLLGFAALLAQQSTTMNAGLLFAAGGIVVLTLAMLGGVAFVIVARRYWSATEPRGTARL